MASYSQDQKRLLRRIEALLPVVAGDNFFKRDLLKIIDVQEEVFDLQIDIQNQIALAKPLARRDQDAKAHLAELRQLRWHSRRLGDALAWNFFASDRQQLHALSHNSPTPIPLTKESDGVRGIWLTARTQVGPAFGIPLVHDITSCLRVGDITFLNVEGADSDDLSLVDKSKLRLTYRTVEVKTRRVREEVVDDSTSELVLQVTLIGHEPFPDVAASRDPLLPPIPLLPRRDDARTLRQLERMDKTKELRAAELDAISKVDGESLITLSHHETERHRWPELRRAIRLSRQRGYAFFAIDGYVAYAVFYSPEGITTADLERDEYATDITGHLLTPTSPRNSLTISQLPVKEDSPHTAEILPLFLYDIPLRAMREILRGQLVVMSALNSGRVEAALSDDGFAVFQEGKDNRSFRYEADITWPSGERFNVAVPAPWDDITRAVQELLGINSILAKSRSLIDIPNRISIDEFKAPWEDGRAKRVLKRADITRPSGEVPNRLRDDSGR